MTQDYSKYNLTEKENEEKERQGVRNALLKTCKNCHSERSEAK